MGYKHECNAANASRFAEWITSRGGIAVWRSINLSNPGASWSTPALDKEGKPYSKPTWEAANTPEGVITDPEEVKVFTAKEVKRFRVAVRRGAQGFSFKLTDASSDKVRRAVAKAGEGAFHEFDYVTQEAVIFAQDKEISLAEWMRQHPKR